MRTNADRLNFLRKLDESDLVTVTNWEAEFIESNLSNGTPTDRQAHVIDTLIDKYAYKIRWGG